MINLQYAGWRSLIVVGAVLVGLASFTQVTVLTQSAPQRPTAVRIYQGSATAPPSTVTVTPSQPVVAPGMSLQFTAGVTGTTNTSVVWSATGGTIDQTGKYIAGQVAGVFAVSAKLSGGSITGTTQVTINTSASTAGYVMVAPGQNIQTLAASAAEGTGFLLQAGVHRLGATIIPRNGQTFVGEQGTVLSGGRMLTNWIQDGTRWYVTGQTQQGTVTSGAMCRSGAPRCANPEDLFADNVMLQHVASLADLGPGKWFFDYANDRIYVADNPAGKAIETSVLSRAFGGSATGVTVRGLIIEKFASPIQHSALEGGSNWLIEQNEIRFNHGGGLELAAYRTARHNFVHHNGQIGIRGAGNNSVVEDNEISYNNTANVDDYWEAGGTKFAFCDGLTVRRNFVHHNSGPGLWTDIDNIHILYEDNIVEDNARSGIFHEISFDAVIRNNTIRRNGTMKPYPFWTTGAGIEITSSTNVEVSGNILEDNWQGITTIDDHRGTSISGLGTWALRNVNVHDNSVSLSKAPGNGGGRSGTTDTSGTGAYSNVKFTNNTYRLPANGVSYFFWQGGEKSDSQWSAVQPTDRVTRY